jgi:hypothetical protein
MANEDRPFGLRPVQHKSGQPWNGAFRPYYVPSTYGTALFIGDPVTLTGTSNTAVVTAPGAGKFGIGTLPEINKATLGDSSSDAERVYGVIVGFAPSSSTLDLKWNTASTARVVYVADDPDLLFEIQANGAIPAASIGLNAIMIADHSGSTVTGLSGIELDTTGTAPAADASYQLLIRGAVNREDNDTTITHAKVLVQISVHGWMQGGDTNAIGTLGK